MSEHSVLGLLLGLGPAVEVVPGAFSACARSQPVSLFPPQYSTPWPRELGSDCINCPHL